MPNASAPGSMPAARTWRQTGLAHGCTFATPPAGLFGWVDTGVDTDALAQRMLDGVPAGHRVRCSMPSASPARSCASTLPPRRMRFWSQFARMRTSD